MFKDRDLFNYCDIAEYDIAKRGVQALLQAHNVTKGEKWIALMDRFTEPTMCFSSLGFMMSTAHYSYTQKINDGYFYPPRFSLYCAKMGASAVLHATRLKYPLVWPLPSNADGQPVIDSERVTINSFGILRESYYRIKDHIRGDTLIDFVATENPSTHYLLYNIHWKTLAMLSYLSSVSGVMALGLLFVDHKCNVKEKIRRNRQFRGLMLLICFAGSVIQLLLPIDPLGFHGALSFDTFAGFYTSQTVP